MGERERRGCPARAGMDPSADATGMKRNGLPRASGDGPVFATKHSGAGTAAPRERGWTLLAYPCECGGFGCPARAGMDPWQ